MTDYRKKYRAFFKDINVVDENHPEGGYLLSLYMTEDVYVAGEGYCEVYNCGHQLSEMIDKKNLVYRSTILDNSVKITQNLYSQIIEQLTYPDIVEQCIGKVDSEGKLIFEGDLVQRNNDSTKTGLVCWDSERAAFVIKYKNGEQFVFDPEVTYTIVGNINLTPQLYI